MSNFEDQLHPASHGDTRTVIDLSNASFVEVYAIVGIACLAQAAIRDRRDVVVHSPGNPDAETYLARMGLGAFLAEHCRVRCDLPSVRRGDMQGILVELQWFDTWENLDPIVGLLAERLEGVARGQVLAALLESVYEIADNVRYHSKAAGGVMAAQVYGQESDERRVTVAIGDVGVGIRRSLLESGRYEPVDDVHAIRLALKEDVSAIDDPGRGVGLPTTLETTTGLGGTMVVRSGAASRRIYRSGARNSHGEPVTGTIVGVSIPCR